MRVTADTNVYISALNFGGMPERLLRLAKAGAIQLVTSDAILAEVGKVLRGDKFGWPEAEIKKAQQEIASISERVEPTETLHVLRRTLPTIASWNAPQRRKRITSSAAITICCG